MRRLLPALVVFFFLAGPRPGTGQSTLELKVYDADEGLSHRNTFRVHQAPAGFLWIATLDGLNQFDGYGFQMFHHESQERPIPRDYLTDLLIANDTTLWLASDNMVFRFNPLKNDALEVITFQKNTSDRRVRVQNRLYPEPGGSLLVTTFLENTGAVILYRLSAEGQLEKLSTLEGNYGNRPVLSTGEFIYIGASENELWRLSPTGSLIDKYSFPLADGQPSSTRIIALQQGPDGLLWALLENDQVYFRQPEATEFEKHPVSNMVRSQGETKAFLAEENGDIWISSKNSLWFFQASTGKLTNLNERITQLTKNKCTYRQIYKDQLGLIWIATDFGLIKTTKYKNRFQNYLSGGHENCSNGFCSTRGITEDRQGNIYISYYNSIHVLDPQTDVMSPLFPRTNFFNFPFDLLFHKGALYTGNGRRIDLRTLQIDTILNRPSIDKGVVMVDNDGLMWFGYQSEIYHYSPRSRELRPYKDPRGIFDTLQDISFMYQQKGDPSVWVATYTNGLYQFDKETGCINHLSADSLSQPPLSHHHINALYIDQYDILWLATAYGLNRVDLSGRTNRIYTTDDGLSNNYINGILSEGDSCLWVSTDKGLCRFDIQTGSFTNYYKQDGLSENEFNRISFMRASDGRFYFGGLNGVNAFFPGPEYADQGRAAPGQLALTSFSFFDKEQNQRISRPGYFHPAQTIRLTPGDQFLSLEYALINFGNANDNYYQYLLENFHDNWSKPSTRNYVIFNNIPPGDYTFRVRTSKGLDNWQAEELAVPLKVVPAFYQTNLFKVLAALFILAIFFGFYRLRVYRIQQRERALEREVKARTSELRQEKQKSEELLLNILPSETAEELKQFGRAKAKRYEQVTVLFSDFKGFTKIAEAMEPEELVDEIDHCFRAFDRIMEKYKLEKIKTIGDAYMSTGGLPAANTDAAANVVRAALEMQSFLEQLADRKKEEGKTYFEARIGIHTGPVVAGIVGFKKFAYDIWGDTVNIASRLEQQSLPGKVNISSSTYQLVKPHFNCTYRGKVSAKNKGTIDMYFVERPSTNGQEI